VDFGQKRELRSRVLEYAEKRGGRIYSPIMHPDFDDIPSQHGSHRIDVIRPHLSKNYRTALDVGSHWGYFSHFLESEGLDVTAAENNYDYLYFLEAIKELCDRNFTIWNRSVFELDQKSFDVVLALNIFHHFIKTEDLHLRLVKFLNELQCKAMFFQAHNPREGQMDGSFRNYSPLEFAEFVAANLAFTSVRQIGASESRPIFLITT